MSNEVIKYWETGQKDLTLNTIAYKVTELHGGESITIKAKAANTGIIYLGQNADVTSTTGFDVSKGEVATFTLPVDFGRRNKIEIWARAATAGDDVSFFKLIDLFPETGASGTRG